DDAADDACGDAAAEAAGVSGGGNRDGSQGNRGGRGKDSECLRHLSLYFPRSFLGDLSPGGVAMGPITDRRFAARAILRATRIQGKEPRKFVGNLLLGARVRTILPCTSKNAGRFPVRHPPESCRCCQMNRSSATDAVPAPAIRRPGSLAPAAAA